MRKKTAKGTRTKPKGPSRLQTYLAFGPFAGLACYVLYSSDYDVFGLNLSLGGLFYVVSIACIVGALPAALTGLITDFISKRRSEHVTTLLLKLILSACAGFILTFTFNFILAFITDEMDTISNGPLSSLAMATYGTIAAIICEVIHSKIMKANENTL